MFEAIRREVCQSRTKYGGEQITDSSRSFRCRGQVSSLISCPNDRMNERRPTGETENLVADHYHSPR